MTLCNFFRPSFKISPWLFEKKESQRFIYKQNAIIYYQTKLFFPKHVTQCVWNTFTNSFIHYGIELFTRVTAWIIWSEHLCSFVCRPSPTVSRIKLARSENQQRGDLFSKLKWEEKCVHTFLLYKCVLEVTEMYEVFPFLLFLSMNGISFAKYIS